MDEQIAQLRARLQELERGADRRTQGSEIRSISDLIATLGLITTIRRRITAYLAQVEQAGPFAPAAIVIDIEDGRAQIAKLKAKAAQLGITVEPAACDEAPAPPATPPAGSALAMIEQINTLLAMIEQLSTLLAEMRAQIKERQHE